jgi:hypothetical protein
MNEDRKNRPETHDVTDPRIADMFEARNAPVVHEVNGFKIAMMTSFPAGVENPFQYDAFHTGDFLRANGKAWATVFDNNREQFDKSNYVILVDHKSGKRIKIEFPR